VYLGQCYDGYDFVLNFVNPSKIGKKIMGNCLKAQNNDDISLLRGNDNQDNVEQALGPPPPYQARVFLGQVYCLVSVCFGFTSKLPSFVMFVTCQCVSFLLIYLKPLLTWPFSPLSIQDST